MELLARGAGAEQVFDDFERLMRNRDEINLDKIFSASINSNNSPVLVQIREFAQCRASDIREELESLGDSGVGKWSLDLTNTALFTLLANWGTEYEQLTAICDNSKPLEHQQLLFDAMINRPDRQYSNAFGKAHPITFNLSGPLVLADSKLTPGIQLADAVSAAAVYATVNSGDEHSEKWKRLIPKFGHYGSIFPELDMLDLKDKSVQRNAVVLCELHSRAKKGESLTDGMCDYIGLITHKLITTPMF